MFNVSNFLSLIPNQILPLSAKTLAVAFAFKNMMVVVVHALILAIDFVWLMATVI